MYSGPAPWAWSFLRWVAERVPEDVTDLVNGSVVEPGTFDDSDYVDTANDGVWSFRTWDSSEVTIDRADAQVVGNGCRRNYGCARCCRSQPPKEVQGVITGILMIEPAYRCTVCGL